MMRRIPMKRGKRKPATAEEKRHFDRLAKMGCLVCDAKPVELHHVTARSDRMGRLARSNERVVPLCAAHHRCGAIGGRWSVESLGHQRFFAIHGVDLFSEAERLWSESVKARRAA